MDKIFWVDHHLPKTYRDLVNDLNSIDYCAEIVYEKSPYQVLLRIIHSLINDYPIILLDSDFSKTEIAGMDISLSDRRKSIRAGKSVKSLDDVYQNFNSMNNWQMTLFTSGTTGLPKKVRHSFSSLTKSVKTSDSHKDDVWGFAYNPTHMAGIQVFFQAFLNQNSMIDLFTRKVEEIKSLLRRYSITHLSATPTFYRLFLDNKTVYPSIRQVSSGGEKLDQNLKAKMAKAFPNARIRNIYASTEAGSLFASEGDVFCIPPRLSQFVKIEEQELILHRSIMGESSKFEFINDWYYSGDLVEILESFPELKFRFLHRKNEMINVGGYKVNPTEVEEELLKIATIHAARVYGKSNSVLGNILCADVINSVLSEREIRGILAGRLQQFKIPRIINFVESMETTRTGKIKR